MQNKPTTNNGRNNPNTNSFEALNHLPEEDKVEIPHKAKEKYYSNSKEYQQPQVHSILGNQENPRDFPYLGKEPERDEDTIMKMDEQDLAEIDLDRVEESLNKKYLQTIPEDQLRKVHKVFLDS
jgi:hypothetical protein